MGAQRCSRGWLMGIVLGLVASATAAEPDKQIAVPFEKSLAEFKALFPRDRAPFADAEAADAETKFTAPIQMATLSEDFAEIQKQFDAALTDTQLLPGGKSKYVALYDAVAHPHALHLREPKNRVAFCTRWLQTFPKSTAAAAIRIDSQTAYAWEARGGGYAYSITEEGGRRFAERLQTIDAWVEEALKNPIDDPLLFAEIIQYIKANGGGHERVDELVRRSAKSPLPTYRPFHAAAEYYLPRWHGEPGELESFALRAYELTKERWGASIYAEIVLTTSGYHTDDLFRDFRFSYPLVEQGIIDSHLRERDLSHPVVQLCWITCYAGQREKAKVLFDYLGADAKKHMRDDFYQQYSAWSARDPIKLGKSIFELKGWTGPSIWEPDGQALLCISNDGLHRIEPDKGLVDLSLPMEDLSWFNLSRDGRYLAIVTDNGRAALFDLQEKQAERLHFSTQDIGFVSVHFTPDGRILARSEDGKLYSWLIQGPDHQEQSWSLARGYPWSYEALTSDGASILAKPSGSGITLWDTRTGKATKTWTAPAPKTKTPPLPNVYLPRSTAISPDDKQAVLGLVRRLQLWNLGEAKPTAEVEFGNAAVSHAAFMPDGKRLLTAMWRFEETTQNDKPTLVQAPSEIILWSLPDLQIVKKFEGHDAPVTHVAVSPDGKRFASASHDRTVRIWTLPE